MKNTEAVLEHTAAADQLAARKDLIRLFKKAPMGDDDLLFNLPLWMRSGVLAKVLTMADLYRRFVTVPGIMVEFGCWFGMNLVLLENLRALMEPFNKDQRRIVAFDSFQGYSEGKYAKTGLYSTGKRYPRYLAALLNAHQKMNVYSNVRVDHVLVEGDVTHTAPAYFAAHPHVFVAFAYFDLGPYKPTLAALQAIRPHLLPGSILLMDELTLSSEPGEALAFKEVLSRDEYEVERCAFYNSKTIVRIR